MRLKLPRPTIRLTMLAVALAAVASALVLTKHRPPAEPGPPWLRYIEVYWRNPDGSVATIYTRGYRYMTPPEVPDGPSEVGSFRHRTDPRFPGEVGSLHKTIADAEAAKLGYRVTIPRAFAGDGTPIY